MFNPLAALAALAITCLAGAPALAGTITEDIAFKGSPDLGATVYGPLFNPALGTLTSLTMTASGSYAPVIFAPVANPTTGSLLRITLDTLGQGGGFTTYDAGTYMLTQSGADLTGPAELFSESATVTNANALSQIYTAFGPDTINGLINIDMGSSPTVAGGWGMFDDLSTFQGTLAVTYTYTAVPEPATLALLACSLCLLPAMRRKLQ